MTLTAPKRLLLVHAHPDDETLTTGGTIARYAARDVQVTLVTCTLGEQGEVIPEHLRGLAADQADQLGGYRYHELRSACAALGAVDQRFLGGVGRWRDSGMVWVRPGLAAPPPDAHPRSFATGDREAQVAALEVVLREVEPQVVVTYADDGGYGHPDHVRAHQVTMDAVARVPAVRRVFHTVFPRGPVEAGLRGLVDAGSLPFPPAAVDDLPTVPDEVVTTAVDVREHLSAKIRALGAHATQVAVWGDGARPAGYALSNLVAQPVLDVEHFVLAAGDPNDCANDLFGGLGG
ncbi:N-acetyl-1-D-myo-inositol-2-amino-2-deoxy-alpha-D-glucopyranoside deacetylase [Actinosynnema sp. NPDC091369]